MVLAEQLKAEALVLLHHVQPLRVLERLVRLEHGLLIFTLRENFDEVPHPVLDGHDLLHVVFCDRRGHSAIDLEALVHRVGGLRRHVTVNLLIQLRLIDTIEVEVSHVVVRSSNEDVDLDRHQLLHEDKVREVRDTL